MYEFMFRLHTRLDTSKSKESSETENKKQYGYAYQWLAVFEINLPLSMFMCKDQQDILMGLSRNVSLGYAPFVFHLVHAFLG